MYYSLVVIDVQDRFSSSKEIKTPVSLEIQKAISFNMPVILVEYGPYSTNADVLRMVKDYRRLYITTKNGDDGSNEVFECLKTFRLPTRKLKICGVNTCYCVLSTVKGLSNKKTIHKLELVKNACSCICNKNNPNCWGAYEKLKKIKLI